MANKQTNAHEVIAQTVTGAMRAAIQDMDVAGTETQKLQAIDKQNFIILQHPTSRTFINYKKIGKEERPKIHKIINADGTRKMQYHGKAYSQHSTTNLSLSLIKP